MDRPGDDDVAPRTVAPGDPNPSPSPGPGSDPRPKLEVNGLQVCASALAAVSAAVAGSFFGVTGTIAIAPTTTARTVAMTAMHVTTLQQFPVGNTAAPRFIAPVPGGSQFATLRQGTMSGIDAAKLALDVQQPAVSVLPTIGQINGAAYP